MGIVPLPLHRCSWDFPTKIEQSLCIEAYQHHSTNTFKLSREAEAVTIRENSVILLDESLDGVRVKCYVLFCHHGNVAECCWSDQRLGEVRIRFGGYMRKSHVL
jgi:hypothetical protein